MRIQASALGILVASAVAVAAVSVSVELKVCGEVTIPTKKINACFVKDVQKGEQSWQVEMCTGLFFEGKVLVLGGGGASMGLCATVRIPDAKSEKEAIEKATEVLKGRLAEPKTIKDLEKALEKKIDRVAGFNVYEDPTAKRYLAQFKPEWKTVAELRRSPPQSGEALEAIR